MRIVALATIISSLLGSQILSCGDDQNCIPRTQFFCHDDVTYLVNSCGEINEAFETCSCGCLGDHSGCRRCNDCQPRSRSVCMNAVTFWVDSCGVLGQEKEACPCGCSDNGLECFRCQCNPDCAGRECGPDGCGGTCSPGCSEDKICSDEGQCQCEQGQSLCRNVCTDLQSDPANCGSCGHACQGNEECNQGVCDPPGEIGDSCMADEECGEQGYCLSESQGFFGGYCLALNCTDDRPCPAGNDCYTLFSDGTTACIRHCLDNSDCRFDEGYICDRQYQVCWPGCLGDQDCPMWYTCNPETRECEEQPPCSEGDCSDGEVCDNDGHCVVDVGAGPGENLSFPLDQLDSLCPDLPELECTGGEAVCGELVPFDPDYGPGYIDYPENGETWSNQYRSFLRRDTRMLIKYATAYVDCLASDWAVGNGQPLGLIDMSEANGSIPGTSIGQPGHPNGTHTNGYDIDVSYYQVGTTDNRARPVCEHHEDGEEAYHCTAAPHLLDPWRTALFLGALLEHPHLRVVGADGKVGPIVKSALRVLCEAGWLGDASCGRSYKLAYEETNQGYGWFYFHHHHMHVSFEHNPYNGRTSGGGNDSTCLIPGCPEKTLARFLSGFGLR